MTRPARIVVVGSSNTDMVVRAPRLPGPGETVLGGKFAQAPGGKGANQAVAAARLGAQVTLIACVGNDVFGDDALKNFEGEGINTDYVVRDPDGPTGVALIGVDEATGENSILVAPGANAALSVADIDRAADVIAAADVLLCQMEVRRDVVTAALEAAHRAGVTTILNPAPAKPLPDYAWKLVSVLTPNSTEAREFARGTTADTVQKITHVLRARGVGSVVVTLGRDGVFFSSPDGDAEVREYQVPKVVDTTAAGDCFSGALAVALGEGWSLREAVPFANAAAALSVTRLGAQPSLPRRAEVEAFVLAQGAAETFMMDMSAEDAVRVVGDGGWQMPSE